MGYKNAVKDDALLHSLAVLPDEVATDCKGKNRDSESKWDFVALITNGPAACNGVWINKVGSFSCIRERRTQVNRTCERSKPIRWALNHR